MKLRDLMPPVEGGLKTILSRMLHRTASDRMKTTIARKPENFVFIVGAPLLAFLF
jgi:hypothetical protein